MGICIHFDDGRKQWWLNYRDQVRKCVLLPKIQKECLISSNTCHIEIDCSEYTETRMQRLSGVPNVVLRQGSVGFLSFLL